MPTRPATHALRLSLLVPLALGCAQAVTPGAAPPPTTPVAVSTSGPPIARKEPKVDTLHGQRREDDYFWLRHKDAPDVVGYLNAENAYTDAQMKPTVALQERIYKEMVGRIKETDLDVPVKRGAFLYYERTEQGQQYPIYCRKKPGGPEQVILDLNEIGKTEKFVGLGPEEISDDGNLLAYGLDTTGFRQYVLHVRDMRTGTELPERIPRVTALSFARDGKTLFYVIEDEVTKRSYRLLRHTLGTDPKTDPVVYEEKDEMFDLYVDRSRSKDFIFATSISKTTSEVRALPASQPTGTFKVLEPRAHDHLYSVDHRGDRFYIRTNSGGRNYRLVTAPVKDPGRKHWVELVPHRADVMLEDVLVFKNHIVLAERQNGTPLLRVMDGDTSPPHALAFAEALFTAVPGENPEFDAPALRFDYASPLTPPSVYDYLFETRQQKLLKRTEVPGGYDPARYETQRFWATASDGVKIPVSLLYLKGTKPDGTHPMFLYGYGSYGIPLDDDFLAPIFSLVDRGLVCAVAHVRGGGELGKKWHDAGRMENKMNTFTDFVASAEALEKAGWADKDKVVIRGGSAGGLLMGAVTNLRPDLWRAVVADVPFVDVVNTMLDETLPLTVGEFEEWGNPKIKEQYDYMMKYSPYDNVAAKGYPAMLVRTSYNDSQVMYWEPAKYVAKLRALKTDHNPLLFKINMQPAGHGGVSGRYDHLHETAFVYSFVLNQLGIKD